MMDLEVGTQSVERVGRQLKAIGGNDLKKQITKAITKASKPARAKVKAAASADLPQRGGLAALVGGATVSSSTRFSGKSPGVRIVGSRRGTSLTQLDKGDLRHPVFGRKVWVSQRIPGGFFSETLEEEAPEVRREIVNMLDEVARRLAGRAV